MQQKYISVLVIRCSISE